jgi:hypothetical protein
MSYRPTSNAATAKSTALSKQRDASAAEPPARPTAPETAAMPDPDVQSVERTAIPEVLRRH